MNVRVRKVEIVSVIDLEGNLYYDTTLVTAVRELLSQGERNILLNLEKIERVDSSGLGEIFACHKRLEEVGGELKVCGSTVLHHTVRKVLSQILPVYETEEEAIAGF